MNIPELPFLAELSALRRDIHAHPELAFDENRTADVVARELERYGLEVHRGIARTGVGGVRRRRVFWRIEQRLDKEPVAEEQEQAEHQ